MSPAWSVACALLLCCPLARTRHDEDFAFDNSEEFQVELTANHSDIEKNGLKKLWGVPDSTAYAGHLFRMEIPNEAFSGSVRAYKVRPVSGGPLPNWLAVDTRHGLVTGVPQPHDVGAHRFIVTAHGWTPGLSATDSFVITVKKSEEKRHSKYGTCLSGQNRLVLVILVDAAYGRITPRQRIRALVDLASFMALEADEFSISPYKVDNSRDQTVLMSGPGSTHRKKADATTAIYFNVGCGDKLWSRHKVLVAGVRSQARDGSLRHTLRLPVTGWRLLALRGSRAKRQLPTEGSGYDYDEEDDDIVDDFSGDGDDDDYYDNTPTGSVEGAAPHPHRHHHGEQLPAAPPATTSTTTTTTTTSTTTTTTTTPAPPPTTPAPPPTTPAPTTPEDTTPEPTTATTNLYTTEEDKVKIEEYTDATEEIAIDKANTIPLNVNPRVLDDLDFNGTETETQTVIIRASNEIPTTSPEPSPTLTSPAPPPPATEPTSPPTAATSTSTTASTTSSTTTSTTPSTTTSTTVVVPVTLPPTTPETVPPPTTTPETETTMETTEQDLRTTTETSSTIVGRTTETVTFTPMVTPNQPPTLKHHMKKLGATAGKAFRYIIPANLFTDPEDGTNLTYTMYEAENVPLSKSWWIQFIPADREVYGLPLDAHVSKWNFIIEARDSAGAVARAPLDVTVRQHHAARTVPHIFGLQFTLQRTYERDIDWQIRALEGIVNLFRDTDMERLTVLNATQVDGVCELVWTNDTLPTDPSCPMESVNRIIKTLQSDKSGAPSPGLSSALQPELSARASWWRGAGGCAAATPPAAHTYPPVTRNQVDLVRAAAGQLLVYTVPEDTFYDPEDGDTRNLRLSLRLGDRAPLPAAHWLQFDDNNQEFYGLPAAEDVGTLQYQLVAEDSSNKTAYDSLVVEVIRPPPVKPTVSFQMTLEYPYNNLAYNANNKRKVVEKLALLFGQTSTSDIRIQNITDNPTTIMWYNASLPTDKCPEKEIEELRKMIIVDERTLRENVDIVFDKEFKVMSITLILLSHCLEQNTKISKTHGAIQGVHNNNNQRASNAEGGYTEYLVTFVIPAVAIVCMILLAGLIACVLYRRRRTGKMSVGDEEERQAFRSKGIPVIFQDELDETGVTEPLHKSPVIMRDEKPPLLPPAPDYRAAPYRPPPPVAANAHAPRPKATPSYRKPPPYVPP